MAIVSIVLYANLYPNVINLLEFFSDEENYQDKALYKKVMAARVQSYKDYDAYYLS